MADSLTDKLAAAGGAVDLLRNSKIGLYVFPVVANEFSNWRDEMLAWRQSAALFDQSHHMDEITVEGPDAAEFLQNLCINSFANFDGTRAKHFVSVNPDGYVIGDMVAFREGPTRFVLVGRAPTANWIRFNHAVGRANVRLFHDPRSPSRPDGERVVRTHYRFEIQGPQATAIFEKMHGGPLPKLPFFRVGPINIGSRTVQALRHGMTGSAGLEFWGPYADKDYIRSTILEAARDIGVDIAQVGSRAYSPGTLESGWVPSPLPAIYSGGGIMQEYRDWLPATSYEAMGGLAGSFVAKDVSEYYVTPFDLTYGGFIRHDHEFIGSEALKAMADRPHRRKVTLVWNKDDVLEVISSAFEPGATPFKWIDFPQANYGTTSADMVMRDGRMVGMGMFHAYSYNERSLLSLAVVDADVKDGDQLTLVWGEPDGGAGKTSTEMHKQAQIRVRVGPVPYARDAQENYAYGWRKK